MPSSEALLRDPGAQRSALSERVHAVLRAVEARGGEAHPLRLDPPASAEAIERVEEALGCALPRSLRCFFETVTGALEVAWFLPGGAAPPRPFHEVFGGSVQLALEELPHLREGYESWRSECFPDPEDPYDRVWHGKLPVVAVANGDYLALDVEASADDPPLVYVSHDDGEGHGVSLGAGFVEALDQWSRLGFVGPEDWQWLPFLGEKGIAGEGERADSFRRWLGASG